MNDHQKIDATASQKIDAAALAQIFTEARTHNAYLDRPVPDALLHEAVDIAKMGPTSANQSPLRIVFLRSKEAKERLRPALMEGNLAKTIAAPVVALTAYDTKFFEHEPYLMPNFDVRPCFEGKEAF